MQYLRARKRKDFPEVPDEDEVPSSAFFGAYLSDAFKTQSPVRPSSSFPPPVPPMDFLPCTGMKIHSISHNLVDRLAGAAWDGCLTCVSHLMTTLQVNPTETPEFLAPFRLSARDAALYGASLQRPMCAEVHLYIEDHLLEMSHQKKLLVTVRRFIILQRFLRQLLLHLTGSLCVFFQGYQRERKGEGDLLRDSIASQKRFQQLPRGLRFMTMCHLHVSMTCTLLATRGRWGMKTSHTGDPFCSLAFLLATFDF